MDAHPAIIVDGKKFFWDGCSYDRAEDASCAAASYRADNFEVHVVAEGGKSLVYTRRVVQHTGVAASQ